LAADGKLWAQAVAGKARVVGRVGGLTPPRRPAFDGSSPGSRIARAIRSLVQAR